MTDQEATLWIVLWCGVNAVVGYFIGKRKYVIWASIIVSILFGPIGWLIAVLNSGKLRKCPFCAELVKPEAVVCKHCGHKLPPPQLPSKTTMPPATKKRLAIGLGIVVTLAAGLILLLVFVPSRTYQPLATNPAPTMTASSDSGPPTTPRSSPTPPEFVTITKSTEARIPETFEMIRLKPGQQLRLVSLAGDQVRVQYGKFEAVVDFYATDLSR
jgi:zinc-ribbon domain